MSPIKPIASKLRPAAAVLGIMSKRLNDRSRNNPEVPPMPTPDAKKRQVAVFDFDGTSVDGQSGTLFTTYLLRHRIMKLSRALTLGVWGIRYKFHLPCRQSQARELVFGALTQMDAADVDKIMYQFHDDVMLPRYRRAALAEVARRREEGCVTLLVSATFEPIAQAAASKLGVDAFIATKMERDAQGNYTGQVEGEVLAGDEKYRSVEIWCDANLGKGAWELAYAYGDHHTDEDLLAHAREAFAVCPGNTLKPVAKKNGWHILDWDK